jgi:YfiH family protein
MPFHSNGNLRYFYFQGLSDYPLTQAIFTRRGGFSSVPWESLNVGGTVGDNPTTVSENTQRIFHSLGLDPNSSYDVWQVHSATVQVADAPRGDRAIHQADILVTDNPQVTLFMRFADCVPIFLYDPIAHAAGIVHAGWKGVIKNAPGEAVRALVNNFNSDPANLIAAIGPSICVDCYPIGIDVVELVENNLGADKVNHLREVGERIHLDLWSACQSLLESEGVVHVENASICTATHLEDWYSHRGENGKTGRFGALIRLNRQ